MTDKLDKPVHWSMHDIYTSCYLDRFGSGYGLLGCSSMDSLRSFGILLCVVQSILCHHHHHWHPGPIDCAEVLRNGNNESKVYRLWPLNWGHVGSFNAFCDMETDGGGWTVFQRRGNFSSPSEFFHKGWKDYKKGFGKLDKDFWLGNDRIFSLTNQGNYTLRIDVRDEDGHRHYVIYRDFWIENEDQRYRIHLSGFRGHSGYSIHYANEEEFHTNDSSVEKADCNKYKGGWWFSDCTDSDIFYLNGPYSTNSEGGGKAKSLRYLPDAEMKVRPLDFS